MLFKEHELQKEKKETAAMERADYESGKAGYISPYKAYILEGRVLLALCLI